MFGNLPGLRLSDLDWPTLEGGSTSRSLQIQQGNLVVDSNCLSQLFCLQVLRCRVDGSMGLFRLTDVINIFKGSVLNFLKEFVF